MESAHRRTQRVRRQVLSGLKFAQQNGIKVRTQVWMTADSACAIGTLFHKRQMACPANEARVAAKILRISVNEVEAFIAGFDNTQPCDDGVVGECTTKAQESLYRLGQRLAKEYVL